MRASWELSQKKQENDYTLKPIKQNENENDDEVYSYDNTPESPSRSPSLSMSDLYDSNAQPIVIQAVKDKSDVNCHQQKQKPSSLSRTASVSSVVANALAVPGALKELIYPSYSSNVNHAKQNSKNNEQHQSNLKSTDISESSNSEDEDDKAVVDWLDEKRRTGMKLVYGLIGSSGSGSTATLYPSPGMIIGNNEENYMLEKGISDESSKSCFTHGEIIDDRTLTNFRKYFVLPETEKLLAGKIIYND